MQVKIRIGAAVDADLGRLIFEPVERASKRARGRVVDDQAAAAKQAEKIALANHKAQIASEKQLAGHKQAMDRQVLAAHLQRTRESMKSETALRLATEKSATTIAVAEIKARTAAQKTAVKQSAAEEVKAAREAEKAKRAIAQDAKAQARIAARKERDAERAEAKAQREREGAIRSFGSGVGRNVSAVAGRAVGIAGDIAKGAGVSFDIASGVQKRVALQSLATDLVNSGHMEGAAGAAGQRQDPRAVMADIQKIGEQFGIAQSTVGEGLAAFTGKTGDLAGGRALLESFAKTAKATGSDFNDVAAAAGAISNKLGEVGAGKEFATIEDKAKAINKVMMALAGQGKAGAVELKDLATQMEKLTSVASKFKPNKDLLALTGGSTNGANIAMLGVLAQSARKTEKGSAAQATQSAMAFVRDLSSQTSIKRIGAKTIFSDSTQTQIRDPQEIIKDIISKTKGDQKKLSYLMSNQNSRAVVNSFMDPYLAAYNGAKGTEKEKDAAGRAAVDEAMKVLKDATLSDKAQQQALDEALGSTATKAEQFQQKLDKVVGDMADKVIPEMLKLAPLATEVAQGFSKIVQWTAQNPGQAITAAIVGSIAKAGLDAAVGKGIEAAISRGASAMGGGGLGALSVAALAITATAVTLYAMNELKKDDEKKKEGQKEQLADILKGIEKETQQYDLARAKEQAEMMKPEVARDQSVIDEARAQQKTSREKIAYLKGDLDLFTSGAADTQANIDEAKSKGPGGEFGHKLGTWLNSVRETFSPGSSQGDTRRDMGSAEALADKLDLVKATNDKIAAILGGGIPVTVNNMPDGFGVSGAGRTGPFIPYRQE